MQLTGLKIDRFFVSFALVIGVVYCFVTPPLQTPDEFSHFYRVWQVSEGQFLPEKRDNRLGGEIPWSVTDFYRHYRLSATTLHKLTEFDNELLWSQPVNPGETTFRDFPNTAYYSPVCYLPQALAIVVLKPLGVSVVGIYLGARIAMLLVWLSMMWLAVRWIPAGKWLFSALLLLPTSIFLVISTNADAFTAALAFFFLSLVLKNMSPGQLVSRRDRVLFFITAILLSQAKLVYTPLVLLVFMIPASNFGDRRRYLKFAGILAALSFAAAFVWSRVVLGFYISGEEYNPDYLIHATLGPNANYHRQSALIFSQPMKFVAVFFNSLFNPVLPYYEGYIAQFGAFLGLTIPKWCYPISFLLLVLLAFTDRFNARFTRCQQFALWTAAITSSILLLLSQYLTWDEVGSDRVWLLQGRYFIPILPLVFLSVAGSGVNVRRQLAPVIAMVLLLLHLPSVDILYRRFVMHNFKTDVVNCGAERLNAEGKFVNHAGVVFDGPALQHQGSARSGKHMALVTEHMPFALSASIPDLNPGDMIEASVWRKGSESALVLVSGSNACPLYHAVATPEYTDREGWNFIYLNYTVPDSCTHLPYTILVHYPGKAAELLDDVEYRIHRKIGKSFSSAW